MTAPETLTHDIEVLRRRLGEQQEQNKVLAEDNARLKASLEETVGALQRAQVPDRLPDREQRVHVLTLAERVRWMAQRFFEVANLCVDLKRQVDQYKSAAGRIVGPDGRPVT